MPHFTLMGLTRRTCLFGVLLLGACGDPGAYLRWQKDFDSRLDDHCIERALRSVSPDVTRNTYVSNGARGFPAGTEVTQFYYPDPITFHGYTLDLALLQGGKTHLVHEWSKVGTNIPAQEQAQILPLMNRANEALAQTCDLSFKGSQPEVGTGD